MMIIVSAADRQWEEFQTGLTGIGLIRTATTASFNLYPDADAFFDLHENGPRSFDHTQKPVFLNSVSCTLAEMNTPPHVVRMNGWTTFLQRKVWEVAGEITTAVKEVAGRCNKELTILPDTPGFISARIIAMIINEAYFALEDGVSTKEEIDIAMKLGTGYPYGPFEWSASIGTWNIHELLKCLSKTDPRYRVAGLLASTAITTHP